MNNKYEFDDSGYEYPVHDSFIKYLEEDIENKNNNNIKYIFVDSLDIDPTFEKYKADYDLTKTLAKKYNFLFDKYEELIPFRKNPEDWDLKYYIKLKTDVVENFSQKRMDHMIKVARVVMAEKVERLKKERNEKRSAEKKSDNATKSASNKKEFGNIDKTSKEYKDTNTNKREKSTDSSDTTNNSENNKKQDVLQYIKSIQDNINTISKSESSVIKEIQLLKRDKDIEIKNVSKAVSYIEKQYSDILKKYSNLLKIFR